MKYEECVEQDVLLLYRTLHTHTLSSFEYCVFMHSDRIRNLKMRQFSRSKRKFITDSTSVYTVVGSYANSTTLFRSMKCSKCPKCLIPSKWKSPFKCHQRPNKTLDNLFSFLFSTVSKWRIISNICKCFLFFLYLPWFFFFNFFSLSPAYITNRNARFPVWHKRKMIEIMHTHNVHDDSKWECWMRYGKWVNGYLFKYISDGVCTQFLCCQNIKLFLDTCKNYYGLRESDLFEPTMLYNLTNFHRVLITLSKLSRRVAQIHPHLP